MVMKKADPELVRQMQLVGNGVDVHTRNKARCYYIWDRTKPTLRAELDTLIRQALASGNWSKLRRRMRRWF